MPNIWTDTAAPYVLAALLGATGWIVNSTVGELKQLKLIEYAISDVKKDGLAFKQVDIYNRSLSFALLAGDFSIRCRGNTTGVCFGEKSTAGTPVEFTPLEGIALPSGVVESAGGKLPIYKAQAQLAAQSAVRYTVSVADSKNELVILYEPGAANASLNSVLFQRGKDSWEGWLIQNYVGWLMYTFIGIAALFLCWCLISLIPLICAARSEKKTGEASASKPEKIYVVISDNGGSGAKTS
jgi:hypothetical protein